MDVLKDVQPVVTRTRRGWIATTPRDHSYRIGVTAASEDEARRCFARGLDGWRGSTSVPSWSKPRPYERDPIVARNSVGYWFDLLADETRGWAVALYRRTLLSAVTCSVGLGCVRDLATERRKPPVYRGAFLLRCCTPDGI